MRERVLTYSLLWCMAVAVLLSIGCKSDGSTAARAPRLTAKNIPVQEMAFIETVLKHDFDIYWETEFPIEVYIDVTIPHFMAVNTIVAAEYWNQQIGVQVFEVLYAADDTEPPVGCGWVIVRVEPDLPFSGLFTGVSPGGEPKVCVGGVHYNPDTGQDTMLKLAIHELGHSLGLAHDKRNIASIMYPKVPAHQSQDILPEHVKAVRKQYFRHLTGRK